ncbi:MAG: hypothetical protein KDJ69_17260, partial [Nitratireductor sp.]|nr:hypothetical protein [Nitratireductor sp.]
TTSSISAPRREKSDDKIEGAIIVLLMVVSRMRMKGKPELPETAAPLKSPADIAQAWRGRIRRPLHDLHGLKEMNST